MKSGLVRSSIVYMLVCMGLMANAEGTSANAASNSVSSPAISASTSEAGIRSSAELLSAKPMVGDDPGAIRDMLAKEHLDPNSPSLSDRIRRLIHAPARKTPHDLGQDLAFVLRAPYGILYREKTHQLTVDVDFADDDNPGFLMLKKTIDGKRGRGLVVAAEAKSKGYIQHIDLIELNAGETSKTAVRGHVKLSPAAFAAANGDFAIVLVGSLAPPYLTDRREHSDPSNDEPTDITTRTSTLYLDIHSIWLVSPWKGVVLSKNLHLSK